MTGTTSYTQYDHQVSRCRSLFEKKMHDYGTAWRILRLSSLVDQLLIKASRIRNIEESKEQKISDSIEAEYIGIINYSIMGLIQMELGSEGECSLSFQEILEHYDDQMSETKTLMLAKNHDYGEVWRLMQRSSLTDLILMKILRMKQILGNDGLTVVSEGLDANFRDMINYSVFALIMISEDVKNATAV